MKNVTETAEIVTKEAENVTEFDYSSVDNETASFLQEKANRIVSIKTKAMIDIAIELEETFAKFAKLPYGEKTKLFDLWVESIGLSPRTARNYLSGLTWVRKNFPNIEDAKNIQTSLLFAVAKQDTPEDIQQGVVSGEITSHKKYQELLKAKQIAEEEAVEAIKAKKEALQEVKEYRRKWLSKEEEITFQKATLEEEKKRRYQLELELRRAQEKSQESDNSEEIENYQSEIGILNTRISELKKQLQEKPLEVSATRVEVKNIIPEEIKEATYNKISALLNGFLALTDTEVDIFADVAGSKINSISIDIDNVTIALGSIKATLYKNQETLQSHIYSGKEAPCEDCTYCTWQNLSEKDELDGLVICTMYNSLVENAKGCKNFMER